MERADRDAENRGIHIDHEHGDEGGVGVGEKRKRPGNDAGGLVKGEAGFLRGAQSGEVQVVRAPRGMTRNKQNNSRWHLLPLQQMIIFNIRNLLELLFSLISISLDTGRKLPQPGITAALRVLGHGHVVSLLLFRYQ